MKNTPRFVSLARMVLAGSAALLLAPSMSSASALTWKGNTSTDIADLNWLNGATAAAPVTGDTLTFNAAGTSGTSLTNTGTLSVGTIIFSASSSAYTLNGNSITLAGNLTNSSSLLQTFNTDLALDLSATRAIKGVGNLLFAGTFTTSGSGAFNLGDAANTGTITFSNTFTSAGSLNIGGGQIVVSGDATAANFYLNTNRLTVNGAGTITNPTNGTVAGGIGSVFTIDNSVTNVNNRLNNVTYRGQGGVVNYISNNNAAGSTDTFTKFSIGQDVVHTTVNLTANTSGSTVLKFGDITRGIGSTLLVQGQNLGAAPGANATNLVLLAGGSYFTGGNGAAATNTISILPFAVGQDTAKTGNDQYGFLTSYAGGSLDTTNGLRNLDLSTEYDNTIVNNATVLNNVNLTTAATGLSGAATKINSLRLDNGGSVVLTGTMLINSGAILALDGNGGISGGVIQGTDNKDLVITTVGDLTIDSNIASKSGGAVSLGLTKTGAGTLTISASSSRIGTNSIVDGTLKLSGNGNLGAITNTLNFTGTNSKLDLNGVNLGIGTLGMSSGGVNNVITNNGTQTATLTFGNGLASNSTSFALLTDGASKLAVVKTGTNTLTLSKANSYTGGTTVESGTLTAGASSNAFGASTGTLTVNGGAVNMNSYSVNIGALNGTGGSVRNTNTTSGAPTFTVGNGNANGNYAGQIMNDTGTKAISLVKTGLGTQILSGANTYAGTTTINGGTLQFGKAVSLYNGATASWTAANIKVANGATLAINVGGAEGFSTSNVSTLLGIGGSATTGFVTGSILGLDTTNDDFEYGSAIGNAYAGSTLGLTKLGLNKLTLSGVNTYSGATTVAAGALSVNGSLASASTVTVASGATLGGTGIVNGAAIINGKIAAGDGGIGVLKTGDLTLGATSSLEAELGSDGTTTSADLVQVTGSVNIADNSELKLTLAGLAPVDGDIFFLVDNNDTDAIVGNFSYASDSGLVSLTEGTQFRWNSQYWKITYQADATGSSFTGGNDIALQAVPEPATWALLVGGFGMLIATQRLRKRSMAS